jgi:hypothetical protein
MASRKAAMARIVCITATGYSASVMYMLSRLPMPRMQVSSDAVSP